MADPLPDGLRLALTTLTVAPVPRPHRIDRQVAGAAMALAPLVGLLLALVAAGLLVAVRAAGPPGSGLLPAAVALAGLAALTRGLHLDGLADLADGLGSSLPAEPARQVMKAPDVGALGLAAVVLVLLVQLAALAQAAAAGRGTAALLVAGVTSRLAVTAACTPWTPAASPGGLGALVAGTVRPRLVALLGLLAAAGAAGVGVLDGTGSAWADGGRALVAVVVGLGVAALLLRHAVRRLGGVSGDVLGGLVELSTAGVLLVMALGPAS